MANTKLIPWRGVRSWACTRCGGCCRFIVQLTAQEGINIAREYGYEMVEQSIGGFFLRKTIDGLCPFLLRTYGGCACGLQREKPLACKIWPFKILVEPKYGYPNEAAYNYKNNIFYIYAIPNCPGFSWGRPSAEFRDKILPEFIDIRLGTVGRQHFSTSPYY